MPGIIKRSKYVVGVFDDGSEEISYCRRCLKEDHIQVRLVDPTYDEDEDEIKPSDYYMWRQCPKCSRKYKKREVKRETRVTDFVEVDEGGDEDGGYAESAFKAGRKSRLERYLEVQEQQQPNNPKKDPDALREIKQGKKVVNFQEYEQRDGTLIKL